jgi:hypothetical protein
MRIIKQTWRGIHYLPVVGDHPGTIWVVAFILIGAVAGGWHGALIGCVWVPVYLYGAYERAEYSDRHTPATMGRCNLCGEPYVGLALDCRCTNYGR